MANLIIANNNITITGNSLTVNYATDVTLSKVELTKDDTNYITASSHTQTSATFNVSSWENGTYPNCKLRITYEATSEGGGIPDTPSVPESSLTITDVTTGTFTTEDTVVISYTTNAEVTKHEFNMHYDALPASFSDGSDKVISFGNEHIMRFLPGELSSGIKTGAIRVTDANGNTAVGQYTLYITEGDVTSYAITNDLANCTSSNSATSIVAGTSYTATISANSDYTLSTLKVTMGGTDITSSAVIGNAISINNVTGDIAIIANAKANSTTNDKITISNVVAGTFKTSDTIKITYTTNKAVATHYFNNWYSGIDTGFSESGSRATSNGLNHTLTFPANTFDTAGTRNGAIKVVDTDGNIAIGTYTLIIANAEGDTYGEIVLSTSSITVNEAATTTFNVRLASAPNKNQVVNLSVNNSNCSINKTSLTFTPSNYSTNQTVTVTGARDTSSYVNKASTITLSSNNVSNKSVGVTIKNIDTAPSAGSGGKALDDWDVYNNTYSYNAVAYMASQVGVSGKAIRITADKKTVTVTPKGGTGTTTTKNYVSGGLVTKKAFKYGTFTFKCKLSANNTYLWAMIWTLPDSDTMARPEFDLWESWGSKTSNNIVQTYHGYDSSGNEHTNHQQAMIPVDLTKEHTVKAVWTQDNVFKMYCDGVLKLTIKDYMVNWKTGQVDYQLWFLNLGLGTYAGDPPNGTGWMEITDYTFEPVYTKTRTKQHTWCGNWSDGTAPSGPLPSTSGSSGGGSTPSEPSNPSDSIQITSINVLSSTTAKTQINYTTNKAVTKHYFNMWYSGADTGFTDGSVKVTNNGNNNYTMTFTNELGAGTKSPAIKVEDASGNTYTKTFSLTVT